MGLKLKTIILISSLGMLVACQKIIEIDLPKHEIKPVINCLFSPNRPFKVHVSLSKGPTDTITYSVDNARVEIIDKNGSVTVLKNVGKGYYSNKLLIPKVGVKYTLKAKIPDFKEISATSYISENKINIKKIESKSGNKTTPVMGSGEEAIVPVQYINIDFLHDMQVADFMGVTIIKNSITHYRINDSTFITENETRFNFGFLESEDLSIKTEGLDSYYEFYILLFRDLLFNESAASVKFNFEKQTDSKFLLRFFHFSPEAFSFLKSRIVHYYTQDYDFWEVYEPQPQYSNIENGYGIFAGYSEQIIEMYPDSTITF